MFRGLSGTARRWRSAAVGGRGMEERMKVPRRTDGTAATTTTTTTWSTSWLTRQSISGAKQTAVVHQTIYHLTTRGVHTRTPGLNIRERAHNNINIVAVDLSPLPQEQFASPNSLAPGGRAKPPHFPVKLSSGCFQSLTLLTSRKANVSWSMTSQITCYADCAKIVTKLFDILCQHS